MALDLPVSLPGKAEAGVCHSHQRKRTHDETTQGSLQTESKKPRTMPPPALKLAPFLAAQSSSNAQSQPTYQHQRHCPSGVDFGSIDYNSPATTAEPSPVSPKSLGGDLLASMEIDDIKEKQPEQQVSPANNNQVLMPGLADAANTFVPTPASHFSENSSPANSFLDSFNFVPSVDSFSGFQQTSLNTCSSTEAQFGSFHLPTPCQHQFPTYAPCHCSSHHACHSHQFSDRRHSCSGWRRASSMTLPVCFQDHPSCHETFMAPHTAPLPVEPAWVPNMKHQPLPSSPFGFIPTYWPQNQHMHTHMTPNMDFTSEWSNAWGGDVPIHSRSSITAVPRTPTNNTSDDTSGNVASADTQSWVHNLDVMMNNTGHWYI